jgi:hypothetical protein
MQTAVIKATLIGLRAPFFERNFTSFILCTLPSSIVVPGPSPLVE